MQGSMMQLPLLISSLLVHAERHHPEQQIVSRRVEGDIHRMTYRELAARARRMANALKALGVKQSDRVATLAWNGYRHLELYYAVSGSGAHAGQQQDPGAEVLRGADRRCERRVRMADVRRGPGVVAVLHVGDDRQPEGRPLQPSLDDAAHLRDRAARRAQLLGEGVDPAGRADVPRQRVGPAVRGVHDGVEARLPRRRARRQVALRAVRERARHAVGRRADGLARAARVRRVERPQVLDDAPHRHRRLGVPAGDDEDVPGALRRPSAARVGHDRDEPRRSTCPPPRASRSSRSRAARSTAST